MAHKGKRGKQSTRRARSDERFLLEQFSQSDLQIWRYVAAGVEEYNIRLFFHLEGLRQLHSEEISDALRNAGGVSQNLQGWCRIVDYQYSIHPLSARGSLIKSGRFNFGNDLERKSQPTFPALYCAGSHETAYVEKFGASGKAPAFAGHEFALRIPTSFSVVQLNGVVKNVFDLKRESNLKPFLKVINKFGLPDELKKLARELGIRTPYLVTNIRDLKFTFMRPDWRSLPMQFGIPSNPQIFGNLLRNAGFEGVLYPSSKGNESCLAVFPENLTGSDSFVELADATPAGVSNIRLDANTWRDFI